MVTQRGTCPGSVLGYVPLEEQLPLCTCAEQTMKGMRACVCLGVRAGAGALMEAAATCRKGSVGQPLCPGVGAVRAKNRP